MKRALVLLTAATLLFGRSSLAETTGSPSPTQLYGSITGNVVLLPNTNYEVIGDLTIEPGASLTLSNRTTLRVAAYSDYLATGLYRGLVEITVKGQLLSNPTDSASISPTLPTQDCWGGISLASGSTLNLKNTRLGPLYEIVAQYASITMTNCVITTSNALHLEHSPATLMDCSLKALWSNSGSSASLTRCAIGSINSGGGLSCGNTSTLTLADCSIWGGVYAYGQGASASLARCSIDCDTDGVASEPQAAVYLEDCSVLAGSRGAYLLGSSSLQSCKFTARGSSNNSYGILLYKNISAGDSLHPKPNIVSGFNVGVFLADSANRIDHMIIRNCTNGISSNVPTRVTYSTFSDVLSLRYNQSYLAVSGPYTIENSILRNTIMDIYLSKPFSLNYVDWYNDAFGAWNCPSNTTLGASLSSYNPFFSDSALHLSPASFYTNFSSSGGQIGAYGPGPIGPPPVLGVSLIEANSTSGKVRIRWRATSTPNSKASVFRRNEGGNWQPLTVLYPDGEGYVVLEDEDVEAGARYGYGLGIKNGNQVGIDGEAWVTVEAAVKDLQVLTIGPNPGVDHWDVVFAAPAGAPTTVDVLDVMGRVVGSSSSAQGAGRHTVRIDHRDIRPGIYWVRLRQDAHTLLSKAVKMN